MRIAKDMERWAKEQANKKKETLSKKSSTTTIQTTVPQAIQTAVEIKASAGFNQIENQIAKPKEEVAKTKINTHDSLLNKKVLMNIMPFANNNNHLTLLLLL
jgi:hypothetical protein